MNRKRSLYLPALIPIALMVWAMKSAASWRPQLIGTQSGAVSCHIAPNGRYLLVSSVSGWHTVNRMWDVQSRRPLWSHAGFPGVFSPDGKQVVLLQGVAPGVHRLTLSLGNLRFDVRCTSDGALVHSFTKSKSKNDKFEGLIDFNFSQDGQQFYVATVGHLWRWNGADGKLLGVTTWDAPDLDKSESWLKSLHKAHSHLYGTPFRAISPDGFSYYTVSPLVPSQLSPPAHKVQVSRLQDDRFLWSLPNEATFSLDGKRAYIPSKDGLTVVDAHTGSKLRMLPGPTAFGFAPSPDGNWLYEARDGKIYRWRAS